MSICTNCPEKTRLFPIPVNTHDDNQLCAQADWNETDTRSPSYIQNKPDLTDSVIATSFPPSLSALRVDSTSGLVQLQVPASGDYIFTLYTVEDDKKLTKMSTSSVTTFLVNDKGVRVGRVDFESDPLITGDLCIGILSLDGVSVYATDLFSYYPIG